MTEHPTSLASSGFPSRSFASGLASGYVLRPGNAPQTRATSDVEQLLAYLHAGRIDTDRALLS